MHSASVESDSFPGALLNPISPSTIIFTAAYLCFLKWLAGIMLVHSNKLTVHSFIKDPRLFWSRQSLFGAACSRLYLCLSLPLCHQHAFSKKKKQERKKHVWLFASEVWAVWNGEVSSWLLDSDDDDVVLDVLVIITAHSRRVLTHICFLCRPSRSSCCPTAPAPPRWCPAHRNTQKTP